MVKARWNLFDVGKVGNHIVVCFVNLSKILAVQDEFLFGYHLNNYRSATATWTRLEAAQMLKSPLLSRLNTTSQIKAVWRDSEFNVYYQLHSRVY